MEEKKKISQFKRAKRIVARVLVALFLLLLTLGIVLSLPVVQTKIGALVTERLNKDFSTDISVEQVAITVFGSVKLKTVLIRDHHKDTLIFANRIQTDILSARELYDGNLIFGDIRINALKFFIKTYKGEKKSNLDVFVDRFETGKPSKSKFLLQAKNAYIQRGRFRVVDANRNVTDVDFTKLEASISNFQIYGPDVQTKINQLSFKDSRGITVEDLRGYLKYGKTQIKLSDFKLLTSHSELAGNASLDFKPGEFADFENKVVLSLPKLRGSVSGKDIKCFYSDLAADNQFELRTDFKGTLNNFTLKNTYLRDSRKTLLSGNLALLNSFGDENQKFFMTADLKNFTSDYASLCALIPNVIGKSLPKEVARLGLIQLKGKIGLSRKNLDTNFGMNATAGKLAGKLKINGIDDFQNATYKGTLLFEQFKLGKFIGQSDIGLLSMTAEVDGSGFNSKNVNTSIKGKISNFGYNRYNYRNIVVDGELKSPLYRGSIIANDPNLYMDFDGAIDLSKRTPKYDFHALIDFANLRKLRFTTDSIAVFKGDIKGSFTGTTLDNAIGEIVVNQTSYQNQNDTYLFDAFTLSSSVDAQGVKTIEMNSPEIIAGKVSGKFRFQDVVPMVQNAVGSLYTNYKPFKVKPGQYLKFNLSIYNKIVEIFYPEIKLATNTFLRGSINSDNNDFKFNFTSPNVVINNNELEQIRVIVDNKNPLYNAFIELDSIKTKYYKISDFNLINVTSKDTMRVRTEFKGGKQAQDYYNLNFFHTIDKDNNNVVGIKKSELHFKDYLWFLNETDNEENKVIFDKKLSSFDIRKLSMTHENQRMDLVGIVKDSTYKDLNLSFEEVNLGKIIPTVDSLNINGRLNGAVNIKQNKQIFEPTASISIADLEVNKEKLGQLNVDIEGDNTFKKFNIDASLENENVEAFNAEGYLAFENDQTLMDVDLRLNSFNLAAFSPLGGDVISNIRGKLSGTANVRGVVNKPEVNGRLFLENAGFKIPYLNTDYNFRENSFIDLADGRFLFQNNTLIDTKYKTEGRLNGEIRHKYFTDWRMDLRINANKLLVLDTKDSDDAAYYGTAFINGSAGIVGATDALQIDVNAKSEPGTQIKIPINNAEGTGSNNFMHFLTEKEKYNLQKGITGEVSRYKGLELNFDLNITPDAEIEVILDRDTGHGMRAKGNGILLLEINTIGKFRMTGDYQVTEGSYNFKYRGIIDKRFELKKFSSISWEGDPMRARLNLEAVYTAQANPAVLLDNPSVNRRVPVNVGIIITGNLSSPEPDFSITFPTVSSVLRSEIETRLSDRDTRQTQALTLLSTGGFLSPDGVTQSALTQNLFETATGIFDNLFQNSDDKVKIDLDIVSAERTPGQQTDGSIGFNISTQINDRITVNGKVGVPIGGINESALVGNVEVQYRVNEDGTMNLRFFNRENDINYLGEGIGYTQGIGVTYEVNFDTFKEFINKIFKKKLLDRERTTDYLHDSDIETPDYLNFNDGTDDNSNSDSKKERPKGEAIPSKED